MQKLKVCVTSSDRGVSNPPGGYLTKAGNTGLSLPRVTNSDVWRKPSSKPALPVSRWAAVLWESRPGYPLAPSWGPLPTPKADRCSTPLPFSPHQGDTPKYWFWGLIWRLGNPFAAKSVVSTLLLCTNVKKGQTDLSADRWEKILFEDRRPSEFCPLLRRIKIEWHGYEEIPHTPGYSSMSTRLLYLTSTRIRTELMTKLVSFW